MTRSHPGPSSPPRRVLLLITTSDVGGTESFLANLAAGLDRDRFEPTVCSLCPPGRIGEQIAATGTPVLSLDMSPQARIGELLAGSRRLARLIDQHQIDLVQSLLYRANMLAALAGRLARRHPTVVAGQRSLTPMTGRLAGLGVRWTRRLARHTVAVSSAVKDEIVGGERLDPRRVSVIGNAVDSERFRPGDCWDARRSLGLAADTFTIGGVGRLTTAKGFEHLLEAGAAAKSGGVRVTIVLVGDGPLRESLGELAQRLGISDQVQFLGRRGDLEHLYPALDAFVLSSVREGSPNVLLEAMACGLPVIATRVGGVPELVEHEHSALLIPPADPSALAATLERLANDPALREQLGKAARARIEAEYTLARMVKRHEQLWADLLGRPPQATPGI